MKQKIFLFLLLTCLVNSINAQTKQEWLQYGNESFKNKDYASAAYFYQKYLGKESGSKNLIFPYEIKTWHREENLKDKNNKDTTLKTITPEILEEQYVVHQIAESYHLSYSYDRAEEWYKKSLNNNPPDFKNERFEYGASLIRTGKYKEALNEFENYKSQLKNSDEAKVKLTDWYIKCCHFALDSSNLKKSYKIALLDSTVNSGTANLGANFFGDNETLVFTSSRSTNKFPAENKDQAAYLFDLYTISSSSKIPKNLDAPINTEKNEGTGTLSINKDMFFFTRWNSDKSDCAIYLSKSLNGKWLLPIKLGNNVNADGFQSMQPSLNLESTKLYFASNRPGGFGKMDIWVCSLDESGNPGRPINLGPTINTTENEATPFFHDPSSTLYFSSEGHTGLGGMDIYKCYPSDADSLWSSAFNLGRPINSEKEDAYFVLQNNEKTGYLSSDRDLCKGCTDQYCFKIYSLINEPIIFSVKGVVYEKDTKKIIPNALVTITNVEEKQPPIYLITDESGAYSSVIRENSEYYLKTRKNTYFADATTVSTIGLTESKEIIQDFYLGKIPSGDIVIPGIEYDYDKATLRPGSMKVLDELVNFLNLNSNISIEIGSHTDTRGKDQYNLKLSEGRAKSCVDYLISKGIASDRLVSKGYGETRPLISDEEIARLKTEKEKEDAHQKNRRTAFRTTKEEEIRVKQ